MSGEDKNRLDKLFKTGLEGPPPNIPDFSESDWENLERMLDGDKKRGGILPLWPYLSGVAALLLLALGWWFFQPGKTGNGDSNLAGAGKHQVQHAGSANQVPVHPAGADSAGLAQQTSKAPASQQNTGTAVAPQTPAYAGVNKPQSGNQVGLRTITGNRINNSKTGAVNGGNAPATGADHQNNVQLPVVQPTTGSQLIADNSAVKPPVNNGTGAGIQTNPVTSGSQSAQQAVVSGNADSGSQVQSVNPGQSGQTNAIANAQPEKTKPVKTKVKPVLVGKSGPQFAITMLASPDINGVGSFKQSKVGTNIGMLFSVGLGRLSISTGAAYSKKPYLANFADYHTSYQFKTNPVDVYADCRVLDIPLNVDYKLYNKNKNAFSVGTGLSSYIMLKERYTYDYPATSTPGYTGPAEYTVYNRNRHILGVLNLNTTYQRELNSKFSVAVQPYLKIPLTNIGQSQVRLQSAGVSVGFSWKINPSKTP